MSDERDELQRQAVTLRDIMNRPFEPKRRDRKPKDKGDRPKLELDDQRLAGCEHDK